MDPRPACSLPRQLPVSESALDQQKSSLALSTNFFSLSLHLGRSNLGLPSLGDVASMQVMQQAQAYMQYCFAREECRKLFNLLGVAY